MVDDVQEEMAIIIFGYLFLPEVHGGKKKKVWMKSWRLCEREL